MNEKFNEILIPNSTDSIASGSIGCYFDGETYNTGGFIVYGWSDSKAKEYVTARNSKGDPEKIIFIPVDPLKGDVNRDGEVNSMDVAYMLSYAARESAGLDTTFQDITRNSGIAEDSLFWAADVDDSGEINSRDAAYTLSYVANLSVGNEISWSDVIR